MQQFYGVVFDTWIEVRV